MKPGEVLSLLTTLLLLFGSGLPSLVAKSSEIFMIPVEGEGTKYWPRWRGPSGQGVVSNGGYPDSWSTSQNVKWRTPVAGQGHSSPIIWDQQIFITTSQQSGRRVSILSYDRNSGEHLWETQIPEGPIEATHPKNTQASSTLVTDGTLVYGSFGSRGLVAVDLEGHLIWHTDTGTLENYHGSAGSPLLYQDLLITYQDHRQDSFIGASDKRTGENIWRTGRSGSVGWGSPVAVRVGDHNEIIVSSQRQVTAYNPTDGSELWHCDGNLFEVIPTPVVGQGLIFCASGRAGPTLAIRPGGRGNVTDTHVAWSTPRGSPFVPSPLVYGDYLYTVNDMSSVITCFEASTGAVMWQERLGSPTREGFSASPIGVDDKVFVTSDEGLTFVLRAGADFELIGINDIGARTLSSPALVDQHWYIRTEHGLVAIGY